MKISFFDWDSARSLLQRWFGYFQPTSMVITYSPIAAGTAFFVQHNLPTGVQPNSVYGTVMSGGFIYYYEADKQQWTSNDGNTPGHVFVRCSVAKAKCEIHISSFDDQPTPGNSLGVSPTSGTGITGLAYGGTGTDLSATGGASQYVKQAGAGAVFTVGTIPAADVPSLDASKITTGQLTPARGGTGVDTSGSTGVPRVSAGTWTTNAGISHLASSTSADLRGVLSDETGTGLTVFATSPTLTTPLLGTPTSGTLTNCTGLPVGSGVSGLGTGVATFLATPSSSNLISAITDETGTGSLVFGTSPTLVTPLLGTPTSGTLTNCTGLPVSTGVSGLGTNVATFLATPSSANLAAAVTDETGTGALVLATSPTLTTPTIGSLVNATHSHQNSAGGGTLDAAAIAAGKIALARGGTNADLSATGGTSQVLKQTSAGAAITVATLAPSELNVSMTDVAYSAGNFTSGTGTWTVDSGDQTTYRYILLGSKLMLLMVKLDSTTTATTPSELRVAIPASGTAAVISGAPFTFSTDGFSTYGTGLAQTAVGAGYIRLFYTNLGVWPNATNLVHATFTMWISLQ